MKQWVKSEEHTCPKCGEATEFLEDDELQYAERCPQCGWRNNFVASTKASQGETMRGNLYINLNEDVCLQFMEDLSNVHLVNLRTGEIMLKRLTPQFLFNRLFAKEKKRLIYYGWNVSSKEKS